MTAIAYRKPEAICDVLPGVEDLTSPEQIALFARGHRAGLCLQQPCFLAFPEDALRISQ